MEIDVSFDMRGLVPASGVVFTPSCSRLSH